ncbi:MAG: CTP synthase (glutamine hydrolyzing) [Candidatus Stahlbacteria bacterium]|nr:CTP synthase (glutamine hydrolyzing) [Candidatus Stahlbacteria bacterium]
MEKYVVVIGGVLSGIGKGIATASIGRILTEYGYKTTAIKIDPYINYDAGTLRPTEHGEVWVTNDGGEIDQDLGSYERFIGIDIPKSNNITTGQIYKTIIDRERQGEYLGKTVQFIPHIPDEIKRRIRVSAKDYDITLIEIGGTVGDYENIPFLFAIKGIEREIGKENMVYVLITFLPIPSHIGEMKTKPTQQAIKLLQENGIIPDIILCRGREPLDDVRRQKIETYANIKRDFVISAPDIELVYDVPINFEHENLGKKIMDKLCLPHKEKPNWTEWQTSIERIKNPNASVKVGICGKYVDIGDFSLKDAYISINESLLHAGAKLGIKPKICWIDSKDVEQKGAEIIKEYDSIIIPGGFGATGIEGKILTIQYVREHNIPFLGLCLGMQLAAVEYARNVANLKEAHSTEVDEHTPYPICSLLPSQKKLLQDSLYGATMRLGAYAAYLEPGTKVYDLYKQEGRIEKDMQKSLSPERLGYMAYKEDRTEYIIERHRHRYEVTPKYEELLASKGIIFSGHHYRSDGVKLAEFLELPGHTFFVATQSHPEFMSRFLNPAPLFLGLLKAAI